jgi:serine protease Do
VKRLIERLRKGKEVEYGFLGVAFPRDLHIHDELNGIPIRDVTPGSPAQRASLQSGDVIKSINGVRTRTVEDLFLTIGMLLAGSEANLEIERRGRLDVVKVNHLAKFHVPGKIIATNKPPLICGFRVDYTSVLWLQQTDFAMFGGGGIPPGVFVSEVQAGSRAASAQLQVNNIITHVNGQAVNFPDEFYREVQKVAATAPLRLTLAGSGWPRNGSTELTIP